MESIGRRYFKGGYFIPIEEIQNNCKYLDQIRELKEKLKETERKKNILLEKINNLEIQNYLLKKKNREKKEEKLWN